MTPLISVIVPVYNATKYLDRCVTSIINQTYKNLEIILVDDGSKDDSPQMCDEYAQHDKRVKVIHKVNGGVCSARNAGLNVCKGEYIGFVDSDDWIEPTMYEHLLSLCKENGVVATISAVQVTESGAVSTKRAFLDEFVYREQFLSRVLRRKDGCAVWSRLFPRDVIGDVRFNEERLNEEILLWISIIDRIQGVVYSSTSGYNYFQTTGSLSRSFGKSVHDMVGNSTMVREYVNDQFPSLEKEAEFYEIYQHMAFLMYCSHDYDRKGDPLCREVQTYVRKHMFAGLKNPYFSCKDKFKLIGVSIFPETMSRLVEKRIKQYE